MHGTFLRFQFLIHRIVSIVVVVVVVVVVSKSQGGPKDPSLHSLSE